MTKIIWGIAFLFIGGCMATSTNINKVSLGMSKTQVLEIMGDPISVSAMQGKEYLNYALSESSHDAFENILRPYYIRIIDGKVDAYGRHGDFGTTALPTQPIKLDISQKN